MLIFNIIAEIVTFKEIAYFVAMALFFYMQQRNTNITQAAAVFQKDSSDRRDKEIAEIKVTTNDTAATTNIIHKLSNNQLGTALREVAVAKRKLANITKLQSDTLSAELAEKLANEHDTKQAEIDAEIARRNDLVEQVKISAQKKEIAVNNASAASAATAVPVEPVK